MLKELLQDCFYPLATEHANVSIGKQTLPYVAQSSEHSSKTHIDESKLAQTTGRPLLILQFLTQKQRLLEG